jgi:nitroreductase
MIQPNPTAMAFLSNRRSRPAKLFNLPVPDRDDLRAILTAALRVPDHGKLTPWRLMVLERPAMARLADLAEDRAIELGADEAKVNKGRAQYDFGHLAVAVISSPKQSDKPLTEQVASANALCMNILTGAEAAGWGANWLTGWTSHDQTFAARAFGCSGAETVAGIIHIGTPPAVDAPDRPRPDLDELVTWVEE